MDVYAAVKRHFQQMDDVVVNSGKGAQGIKYKGKMFVMFFKGDLMVKLDPDRVVELVRTGPGVSYPHAADRVIIPVAEQEQWIDYALESYRFASS